MNSPQIFIHHPENIQIELSRQTNSDTDNGVQKLGLKCYSDQPYPPGIPLQLRIPSVDEQFTVGATVSWCHKDGQRYKLGLQFNSKESAMKLRMLEQLCHILCYKQRIFEQQGIELSDEQAAAEWIQQYAPLFPCNDM